ncbi:polyprotein [Plakobranchus ocellatus]|uniref:Polyprotein n=1 Tax=Plakobranchus ocellatus TaxID=259542 RepID=A0AAV4BM55_9GAST|nr:polyprotein [Plakobranchus ocellatus]
MIRRKGERIMDQLVPLRSRPGTCKGLRDMKQIKTPPVEEQKGLLCGKETTEHVFSSCKVSLSQGRYTWRHNRVLQELAIATCGAKGMPVQTKARALVFTSEGGTKSRRGSATGMDTQRKSLQDRCDDYEFSADLHKLIQDTKRGMTSYSIQVLLNKSSYRTHSTT